jgi:hypothetical protein
VLRKLIMDFWDEMCKHTIVIRVTEKELGPYSVCVQIVRGIGRQFKRRFRHV